MTRHSRNQASTYICTKDARHKEIALAGQKKRCWQCSADMKEYSSGVVTKCLKK